MKPRIRGGDEGEHTYTAGRLDVDMFRARRLEIAAAWNAAGRNEERDEEIHLK